MPSPVAPWMRLSHSTIRPPLATTLAPRSEKAMVLLTASSSPRAYPEPGLWPVLRRIILKRDVSAKRVGQVSGRLVRGLLGHDGLARTGQSLKCAEGVINRASCTAAGDATTFDLQAPRLCKDDRVGVAGAGAHPTEGEALEPSLGARAEHYVLAVEHRCLAAILGANQLDWHCDRHLS
eukprot:scaffold156339_cov32-Tisochrysis_lutea.AAC.2